MIVADKTKNYFADNAKNVDNSNKISTFALSTPKTQEL